MAKIELRKLNIAKNLSEETLAFTAEVWVDGVLATHAKNQGCGGCNMYYDLDKEAAAKLEAEAKRLHPGPEGVDALIGDLIEAEEDRKTVAKMRRQGFTHVVKVYGGKRTIGTEEFFLKTVVVGYTQESQLDGILKKEKADKHVVLYPEPKG